MIKLLLSLVLPAFTLLAVSPVFAAASSPKAVLELFTSQGCSSCPPADRVLADYAKRPDIVALAYHVDYWDYIGWHDTFGSAMNSNYQRAYAQARGKSGIYTPQLMINGATDVVGSRRAAADAAIAASRLELPVALSAHDGMLDVAIGPRPGLKEATVWLVTFKQNADVAIGRGENVGKTVHYVQIVTGRQVLGMWDPAKGTRIKLPLAEILGTKSDGAAVLVQEEKDGLPGVILGAGAYAPKA